MRAQKISALVFALLVVLSMPAIAGGPLVLRASGQPYLWPNGGTNIPWNPDQGNCGVLTNAQAVAATKASFKVWEDLPSASATHLQGAFLPVDVNITNFFPYLFPDAPDGLSAIVFDDTGEIFNLLFGADSGVLGFAGPEWVDPATGNILEGVAFLNGPAVGDPVELQDIMVHEFGHYQNLAHTVVNGQIALAGDNSGPTPNNTFPVPSLVGKIETMYPFYFGVLAGTRTPERDDIAMFSTLYPAATFASTTGSITGTILAPNNRTQLTGINVIARNVADPFVDAVSAISSDFATDYTPGAPFTGRYTLHGLTPGASYAVYIDEILAGGFSTPPRVPFPGPEEFYNGAAESATSSDNPALFTAVRPTAGGTASNINIIVNFFPQGPLPIGDEQSLELFLPFNVKVCGQKYESLFVNDNGTLTFGAPQDIFDFSEGIDVFLQGPPRLAPMWEDFDPGAGGSVSYSLSKKAVTVSWANVPEFAIGGSNTFAVSLDGNDIGEHDDDHDDHEGAGGGKFSFNYGSMTARGGLVGFSCGGQVTSSFELERNLSAEANHTISVNKSTAAYEFFSNADNDLANKHLNFNGTSNFTDQFGRNNTIRTASGGDGDDHHDGDHHDDGDSLNLPFSTVNKFADIKPLGNDIDFYQIQVKAGDWLAIETVPGRASMDTIIGVFDAKTKALLAADDDGGDGLLSRLILHANADLTLAVGVTTFPDFGFTGAGGDSGRYVLQINKYRGTQIVPGDDGAVAVSTGFTFPYQGTNYTTVQVNGNGNLTFGAPDPDFSPSVAEFLSGPPRIAPLWDDLDSRFGLVLAEPKGSSLNIHFVSVPEFFSSSPNYFTVNLDRSGDVDFDFLATARGNGLIGVTKGGGATDPGPTDLSQARNLDARRTTYQLFTRPNGGFFTDLFGGIDLSYDDLTFRK